MPHGPLSTRALLSQMDITGQGKLFIMTHSYVVLNGAIRRFNKLRHLTVLT